MPLKVGIPRALFFYYYYPLWKRFFENLGAEVVVSPPTNKSIIDAGIKCAVDEACLPVKVYYGHVAALKNKVDLMFLPRLVSLERKTYICPKFMGLPDMIRSNMRDLPTVIDTTFDLSKNSSSIYRSAREVGHFLESRDRIIDQAWDDAEEYQKEFEALLYKGHLPCDVLDSLEKGRELPVGCNMKRMCVAVMGHAYNLYDTHISMDLIRHLRNMGVKVITPDIIPTAVSDAYAERLPKRMFWTMGKRLLGSVLHYIDEGKVDGILYVEAFGCGPDSMIEDLSARYVRRDRRIPFQVLTLDEHSGQAGVMTRLEAFVDMISWRGVS
ncbi:MAG: acyl-CoA dehydratase activase-related protein [Bacillota bacterium]|jgi:predicted nucleotide-binding protein (sugar kinase/HSP70/actin superfamily)